MPLVSIIVPVYNAEKYLERCITSIINQTFKDFELIIVDDGSTDRSFSISKEYAKYDSRIIAISKQNSGVSETRNVGISIAKGEYIMFCDSDDYVDKKWCELLVNEIERQKCDLVVCDYLRTKRDSEDNNENSYDINAQNTDFWQLYINGKLNAPFNKIFRKDIIINNEIKFDTTLKCGEDLDFNLKYCNSISKDIFYIENQLYYYYDSGESVTSKYIDNLWEQRKENFSNIFEMITNNNISYQEDIFYALYLDAIIRVFDNNMLNNNNSIIENIKKNTKIMREDECIRVIDKGRNNSIGRVYYKLLKTHNYLFIYIYCRIISIIKR